MLIAALLVIPVIAVEQSDVGGPWRTVAGVLNWAIWIAFTVELVVMLAVVPDSFRVAVFTSPVTPHHARLDG